MTPNDVPAQAFQAAAYAEDLDADDAEDLDADDAEDLASARPDGTARRTSPHGPGTGRPSLAPENVLEAVERAKRGDHVDMDYGCHDPISALTAGAAAALAAGRPAHAVRFHRAAAWLARGYGYDPAYARAAARAAAARAAALRPWLGFRCGVFRRAPRRSHVRRVRLAAVASAGDGPPPSDPPASCARDERFPTGGAS